MSLSSLLAVEILKIRSPYEAFLFFLTEYSYLLSGLISVWFSVRDFSSVMWFISMCGSVTCGPATVKIRIFAGIFKSKLKINHGLARLSWTT